MEKVIIDTVTEPIEDEADVRKEIVEVFCFRSTSTKFEKRDEFGEKARI